MTKFNIFDDPILGNITQKHTQSIYAPRYHTDSSHSLLRQRRKRLYSHRETHDTYYTPIINSPPTYTCNPYSVDNDYHMVTDSMFPNIFENFWSNVDWRDVVKEKLSELGCDIVFNIMPSDEFIESLLNEPILPDESEPIYIKNCKPEDYLGISPVINIKKCDTKKITYDIQYNLDKEYENLFDEILKEHNEYYEEEEKYQTMEEQKKLTIVPKMIINKPYIEKVEKPLQILVDNTSTIEISDLPLGYSSTDINIDDYEILSLSDENEYDDNRIVKFNKEVIQHTYTSDDNEYYYDKNYTYNGENYNKYGHKHEDYSDGYNTFSSVLNWIY